ncbi:MAG: hypothetical protein IJ862_03490 [Selenomonadaceae bacterium]|nr:hypothetical protein [Selenomonadaceae bacterium]
MVAFHTLRTRSDNFSLQRFELLTLMLSALEWKKYNGTIKLVTDQRGFEYLNNLGITDIYDEIDTSLDEIDSLNIDEVVFWAGAKLLALSKQSAPCVMIDLDFIVWQKLDFTPYKDNVAVIHFEQVNNFIYPSIEHFRFNNDFKFPSTLDWSVEACNTAFAYFGANDIIKRYCDFAFEFMQSADTSNAGLPYMVFAEQRWLAMCMKLMRREVYALSSLKDLFGRRQEYFTHIWGYKQKFRDDPNLAEQFCNDCLGRLKHDFPDTFNNFSEVLIKV